MFRVQKSRVLFDRDGVAKNRRIYQKLLIDALVKTNTLGFEKNLANAGEATDIMRLCRNISITLFCRLFWVYGRSFRYIPNTRNGRRYVPKAVFEGRMRRRR